MRLGSGKLPPELLQHLIDRVPAGDPRVVVGPGAGRDAAVLDVGDRYLVVNTDPITFATDELGWYVVQVSANDVACLGAEPRWLATTLLLPDGCDSALPLAIVEQIVEACSAHGVAFLGGHTEVTSGLDRPLVVGTMLGEASRDGLVRPERTRAGDTILLTKGAPIEGAAILARELGGELARRGVAPETIARAAGFLREPGIAVVREARLAAAAGAAVMHDPTEGGVATALWELASVTGLGVAVERERIPIVEEGAELCAALGLDPLGTIASGALLIGIDPGRAGALVREIEAQGIACAAIGSFVEAAASVTIDGEPLPRFIPDEIARALA